MAERISVDANGDFVFMDRRHNDKMLEGLNRLRLNNTFCDVILCCGGKEFPCHRNVLVSFSCYFEAMFTIEWMETRQMRVAIHGVEPQGLEMLVGYAYSSKVVISAANVQVLLTAANLLNVMAVQEACCHYMEHRMDETNCVGIHCFADAHSCKTLAQRSMEYILTHFSAVFRQEEFLSLSVEKVTQILSSENLDVPKEEMVVEAALLWLNRCPTHRHTFEKVLDQIRLPLLSPSYLHDVIESLDVVKESQGCQRLIAETKDPNLMQYSPRARPRGCRVRNVMLVVHKRNDCCYAEIFDPRINRWKSLMADLPLPVSASGHSMVVSGSSLYVAGANGSTSTEMWRYDLRDPDTTQEPCDLSRGPWLQMASMDVVADGFHGCGFGLVMLDGYMYAVGGCPRTVLDPTSRVSNSPVFVERYDPDMNTWQSMTSLDRSECKSSPRDLIALDGLIYRFGTVTTDGLLLSRVKKYDPETSLWTDCAPMQFPRTGFAVCTLKGNIYVIGGDCPTEQSNSSNTYTDKVECYNPQTNQWCMCAPMKRRRFRPGVAVVDGNIYVLMGSDRWACGVLYDIERYNDERDTWRIVTEIPKIPKCDESRRCFSLRLADVYAQTPSSS